MAPSKQSRKAQARCAGALLALAWAGCGEIVEPIRDAANAADAAPDAAVDAAPVDGPPPDAAPCDRGDINAVDPATGHCYMIFIGNQSWATARTLCESLSPRSHLATLTSAEESLFVRPLIGSRDVWIGANDLEQAGTWQWVTGEPFEYTNWDLSRGQPDNAAERCVRADGDYGGRWHDDSCTDLWSFMCEQS